MKELIRDAIDNVNGGIKYYDLYSDVLVSGGLALKTTTQELIIDIDNALKSMPEIGILEYATNNGHKHRFIYRKPE